MEITIMNIIQILIFSSIAFILGYQTGWVKSREKLPVVSLELDERFTIRDRGYYDET